MYPELKRYLNSLNKTQNPDGSWDVNGEVRIPNAMHNGFIRKITQLPIKFGKVSRDFYCDGLGLTTLEGCPKEVGGWFNCSRNQLVNLIGGPLKVGLGVICYDNQLISLEGAPEEVGWDFDCSDNQLRNFKGKPKHIGGRFIYDNNPMDQLMEPGSEEDDIDQIINGF